MCNCYAAEGHLYCNLIGLSVFNAFSNDVFFLDYMENTETATVIVLVSREKRIDFFSESKENSFIVCDQSLE